MVHEPQKPGMSEPVAVISAITTVIKAILACAVGFGLDWTPEQVGLVMAVVVAVGGLVDTILIRRLVSPAWKMRQ